jgi:hypothetical protein
MKELMRKDASASDLSEAWRVPLGNISYHMSIVLYRELSLLSIVGQHPRRGALETVFSLRANFQTQLIATVISTVEAEVDSPSQDGHPPILHPAFMSKAIAVDPEGLDNIGDAFRDFSESIDAERRRCGEHPSGPRSRLIVTCAALPFGSGAPRGLE